MASAQRRVKRKPLSPTASIALSKVESVSTAESHEAARDSSQLTRQRTCIEVTKAACSSSAAMTSDTARKPTENLKERNHDAQDKDCHGRSTGLSTALATALSSTGPPLVHPGEAVTSSMPGSHPDELQLSSVSPHKPLPPGETSLREARANVPPVRYDRSLLSRNVCIGCLVISWCAGIACTTFGIYITPPWSDPGWFEDYRPWPIRRRSAVGYPIRPTFWGAWCAVYLMPLGLNVLVTMCTDSLGFIQTASLRWSLQSEGLLTFNSNLRLLTTTKRHATHRWYVNAVSAVCASTCYAATPLLSTWGSKRGAEYNIGDGDPCWVPQGMIFLCLGVATMGQAFLATWCLLANVKSIPTWSSNPLNTTLTCLGDDVQHHSGRCMMSVHDCARASMPRLPRSQQASAGEASHLAARVVRLLWVLTSVALFWGIAMALSVEFINKYTYLYLTDLGFSTFVWQKSTSSQRMDYIWRGHGMGFGFNPPVFPEFGGNTRNTIHLFVLMLVQGPLVFGLHCLEKLVNMSRDEAFWRRATSKVGTKYEYNAVLAAVRSPQTIALFLGKAAAHWAIGRSFHIIEGRVVQVMTAPVFVLTIVLALLACFGSRLANHKPAGPQPATYGHIKTIADLIDDWSNTMYWGDKGNLPQSNIRHAGTLHRSLKPPQSGARYGGDCCKARRDAYTEL